MLERFVEDVKGNFDIRRLERARTPIDLGYLSLSIPETSGTGIVLLPGQTLRNDGWHLDGLQGDEVPVKQPNDLQFIWSDCLPTRFAVQPFTVDGLDLSVHNAFKWIARQIDADSILETLPSHLYAMNGYHAHTAAEATTRTYRRFVRVSYTHCPVTSVRMTVNQDVSYDYPYHVTSGEIPDQLR